MNEQRIPAYLNLIQQLLDCPAGEENQILNQFSELVDEGFVQMCEQKAAQLHEEGEENQAEFLQDLAQQVGAFLARPATEENQPAALHQFWQQLLQAEAESGGDAAAVHQVMRPYMGLIVPVLGDIIAESMPRLLARNPDNAEGVIGLVEDTCTSMQQFPDGRYGEVLEIAIRGYDVVLALRADNPPKRAQTLNNLGIAYQTQAQFGLDPAAKLDQAITAYTESATIRRHLGLETDLAQTLNNLGNAYQTQAEFGLDPAAKLDQAITAYSEAATIRRRPGLETDLATTLTNLGAAYQTQAQFGIDPAANLDQAITAYTEAVTMMRPSGLEKDLAATLNNLGNAYQTQAQFGIDSAANLDQAITAYREAATIRRRPGLEKDLARTLNNLGLTYQTQAQFGIDPAASLEQAIKAYREAATIQRRPGLEKDLAGTLNNFGFAYQTQSRLPSNSPDQKQTALENAYKAFAEALEQVEYLRGEITTEDYKRQFNEQWNQVYRDLVQVCLELGNYTAAIEYADRSKA
ncbi:MAG TPA: tetratricopeptide repeat protein [Oscillatoriaceae cyanobacterium M33_DOE_052]|uniref:Tetratricopeptide repeat protein n=1 Tax=Planktothricoides sp. SpSt-374 TaxID=2282167 RepID=A0A7C3ZTB4_9CYAN|nr:tetratricopeptide repeat protein [Oscillatoriaceae cyanobacterium M33_DOE_052]